MAQAPLKVIQAGYQTSRRPSGSLCLALPELRAELWLRQRLLGCDAVSCLPLQRPSYGCAPDLLTHSTTKVHEETRRREKEVGEPVSWGALQEEGVHDGP